MAKLEVYWQKGHGKDEDFIVARKAPTRIGSARVGPIAIPARLFEDISRKGTALLRENHYGTFLEPDEISLEIHKAQQPEHDGLFIVNVFVNDHSVIQFWCDQMSKWSPLDYTFSLKGQCICGIGAKKVKIAEELKDYDWKTVIR